jgi:hypothetical protein
MPKAETVASLRPGISPKEEPIRWVGLFGRLGETPEVSKSARKQIQRLKRYFFVSYSRNDLERIQPYLEAARGDGHALWLDQAELSLGARWSADIVAAIRASRGMILFCSASSFASNDVYREVAMAGRFNRPILPVFLDAMPAPDEFLYYLSIHQAIKAGHPDWRADFLGALADWSKPKRRKPSLSPAPVAAAAPSRPPARRREKRLPAVAALVSVAAGLVLIGGSAPPTLLADARAMISEARDQLPYATSGLRDALFGAPPADGGEEG